MGVLASTALLIRVSLAFYSAFIAISRFVRRIALMKALYIILEMFI